MSLYAKCKRDHQLLAARMVKFSKTTNNIYNTLDKSCKYEYSILKEIKSEIESLLNGNEDVDAAVKNMTESINGAIEEYNLVNE